MEGLSPSEAGSGRRTVGFSRVVSMASIPSEAEEVAQAPISASVFQNKKTGAFYVLKPTLVLNFSQRAIHVFRKGVKINDRIFLKKKTERLCKNR